jgi:ATP-dependent exoDNAse (exonuclease V) beta subunit
MMLEIVKKYRNQIYDIIRNLKDIHVENDEKDTAEIIFSTVHKSKGMEYDSVQLVDDYISEDTLRNSNLDDSSEFNADKLNEEINLLYVAITRAKSLVKIPESLLPNDFPPSNNIKTIKKADSRNVSSEYNKSIPKLKFEKSNKMAEAKIHFKSAYLPWTDILDEELIEKYERGISIKNLSKHFGRSKGAILSRIRKISEDTFYED